MNIPEEGRVASSDASYPHAEPATNLLLRAIPQTLFCGSWIPYIRLVIIIFLLVASYFVIYLALPGSTPVPIRSVAS